MLFLQWLGCIDGILPTIQINYFIQFSRNQTLDQEIILSFLQSHILLESRENTKQISKDYRLSGIKVYFRWDERKTCLESLSI